MARAVQLAPAPHQLEPVELPDDGAEVIETSGVEMLDGHSSSLANDNDGAPSAALPGPERRPHVVPFASTLRSIS
jgi:hypothetical protein